MIVREPDATKLHTALTEDKKKQILEHKFAFVCFKSLDGPAKKAVNEVPYYKIGEKDYNEKIDKLVEKCKANDIDVNDLHKCAVYIDDLEKTEGVMKDEEELKQLISEFKQYLIENDGIYLVKDKTNRLDCCQALKKAERAKR